MVLKGYLFLLLLCLCAIGCGDDDDIPIYHYNEAKFVRATPPGGEIPVNGTITVIFDNAPADIEVSTGSVTVAGKRVTIVHPVIYDKAPANVRDKAPAADVRVSVGTVIVSGKRVTIGGAFIPGPLGLTITWADGTHALNYVVIGPDTDPPIVTGGTVKDGEKDVDPEDINTDGQIVVEFSEDVSGNIALQTEGGDDVGWLGKVEGNKAILEFVWGKEISNETTYVIKGKVSDLAGNTTNVSITFVTRSKE